MHGLCAISKDCGEMLQVHEIFASIEGETTLAGWPVVFVRLTGCNLRCKWCDTEYALEGGYGMDVPDVVDKVKSFGVQRVVVTGGEPLVQDESFNLIKSLADTGLAVYIETNGSIDIGPIDDRACIRLDLKPPSSGMAEHNLWENIPKLKRLRDGVATDEVKIVIADAHDYAWAKDVIAKHNLLNICPVNFTPELDSLDPRQLAKWIIDDRLDVRLNLQLHKMIWGEGARGV